MSSFNDDTLEAIQRAKEILKKAENVVAFTGAGISTESGIPDFRSKGGLWEKYNPSEYATYDSFLAHPEKYWEMAKEVYQLLSKAKPNYAHIALAKLEREDQKLKAVITQNIDYLHTMAGNSQVLELHGTYREARCLDCKHEYSLEDLEEFLEQDEIPPRCKECGGIIKDKAILFGEMLPDNIMNEAAPVLQNCDCLLVIGTSLMVPPGAYLPMIAASKGTSLIIINNEPTNQDHLAKVVLRGKASEIMKQLLNNKDKI
jgi:NAD-dependent deacetylase